VQLVLQALLAEPTQEMYGLQICTAAGLPSGTIHPILARFEGMGWLESRWEDAIPQEEGRPKRRYYKPLIRVRVAGQRHPGWVQVPPQPSPVRLAELVSHRQPA
jgi:Transcriptional regulator PadR-like family